LPYKYNFDTGALEQVSDITSCDFSEQYVVLSKITGYDAVGLKGQWSYGNPSFSTQEFPSYWICIATNTWIDVLDRESVREITEDFVTDAELDAILLDYATKEFVLQTLEDAQTEQYVPFSQVTGKDAPGFKGQWSTDGIYLYNCIATNTWYRVAVAKDW